jgi:uncharacterized membrane protein
MASAVAVGRVERIADRWFRSWGLVAVAALLATIASLVAGYEAWRLPFVAAHLAALLALVPLGLVLIGRTFRAAYAERGSLGGAVSGLLSHDRVATVLVLVALVAIAVSLSQFQGGIRWLRAVANYTTVGCILALVVRYLRTR